MVQAILSGRKTQTRRLIKGLNPFYSEDFDGKLYIANEDGDMIPAETFCRFHEHDKLYVRETWNVNNLSNEDGQYKAGFIYKASSDAGDDECGFRWVKISKADYAKFDYNMGTHFSGWRPSIHMPKVAVRLFLRVKNVRAEKLQDITAEDIKAEGVENEEEFQRLWDSTLTPAQLDRYSWAKNPWVYVIEFERINE